MVQAIKVLEDIKHKISEEITSLSGEKSKFDSLTSRYKSEALGEVTTWILEKQIHTLVVNIRNSQEKERVKKILRGGN